MSADEPYGPVVTGPLARYEAPFRGDLVRAGYAPGSVRGLVRTMALARFDNIRDVTREADFEKARGLRGNCFPSRKSRVNNFTFSRFWFICFFLLSDRVSH